MSTVAILRAKPAAAIAYISGVFTKAGLPASDAKRCAELMVAADLAGNDGHGIMRTGPYLERIEAGGINKTPNVKVTKTGASTALVDGDNAMGHLCLDAAVTTGIAMAKETGCGWVGIHHSNHAGAAGVYAQLAADAGMVGIYAAVASANHMAAWGSAEPKLGTNPIAFAIPGDPPFVLDIATTVSSYGKIKTHQLKGLPLEPGWMVDKKTGEPILDADKAGDGVLLPIGGYKGSGLNVMIGLLAGTLNGAYFGSDVVDFNADRASLTNTGQFFMALDVARFRPLGDFVAEGSKKLDDLRASKPLPGFDAVRMPGDERVKRQKDYDVQGIPVAAPLVKQLDAIADRLGVGKLETMS